MDMLKKATSITMVLTVCVPACFCGQAPAPTAAGSFRVDLPAHRFANDLRPTSPFGINTALRPGAADLEARLRLMQEAGIKWGRQDFTWRQIEREPGKYDWKAYDELVEACQAHGLILFGNLAYAPSFHDPLTPEGIEAYCAFARAAVQRYKGKVDYWQIWNEPNGGFWKGTPQQYALLLAAAGQAIHEANPDAKVLGLNMAFCDVLWAETILKAVPYDCFDIACFHPYRPPSAPEEPFDWWELDQYVKSWHKQDLTSDYPLIRMTFLEQTEELVKVMAQFGKPKPLWITEICWNTHIHPYGTSELRQADLLVRFHVLALLSGRIEKVFWWTLKDGGDRQFDQADMVGLVRTDLSPKYAYWAFAWMTRMLEGKKLLAERLLRPGHLRRGLRRRRLGRGDDGRLEHQALRLHPRQQPQGPDVLRHLRDPPLRAVRSGADEEPERPAGRKPDLYRRSQRPEGRASKRPWLVMT